MHVSAEYRPAGEKRSGRPEDSGTGDDGPAAREPVDETGDGDASAIADHRREARRARHEKDDDPPAGQRAPALSDGGQGGEDAVRVHEEQDQEDVDDDHGGHGDDALDEGHAVEQLEHLVGEGYAGAHYPAAEGLGGVVVGGGGARVWR